MYIIKHLKQRQLNKVKITKGRRSAPCLPAHNYLPDKNESVVSFSATGAWVEKISRGSLQLRGLSAGWQHHKYK